MEHTSIDPDDVDNPDHMEDVEYISVSSIKDEVLNLDQDSKHKSIIYPCNQCKYQAKQEWHLKRHQESQHEGVRYPCNECEYQATQQCHLKRHQESQHEDVRYPCNQCE